MRDNSTLIEFWEAQLGFTKGDNIFIAGVGHGGGFQGVFENLAFADYLDIPIAVVILDGNGARVTVPWHNVGAIGKVVAPPMLDLVKASQEAGIDVPQEILDALAAQSES